MTRCFLNKILPAILCVRMAQLDRLFQTLGGQCHELIPFLQRAFFSYKEERCERQWL